VHLSVNDLIYSLIDWHTQFKALVYLKDIISHGQQIAFDCIKIYCKKLVINDCYN